MDQIPFKRNAVSRNSDSLDKPSHSLVIWNLTDSDVVIIEASQSQFSQFTLYNTTCLQTQHRTVLLRSSPNRLHIWYPPWNSTLPTCWWCSQLKPMPFQQYRPQCTYWKSCEYFATSIPELRSPNFFATWEWWKGGCTVRATPVDPTPVE